jgi:hypothetical protein
LVVFDDSAATNLYFSTDSCRDLAGPKQAPPRGSHEDPYLSVKQSDEVAVRVITAGSDLITHL